MWVKVSRSSLGYEGRKPLREVVLYVGIVSTGAEMGKGYSAVCGVGVVVVVKSEIPNLGVFFLASRQSMLDKLFMTPMPCYYYGRT